MSLWNVVEQVRATYIARGFPLVRATHVVLDGTIDTWDRGKRTVASCAVDGNQIWLSPRIASFDVDRQLALIAHEFGHAVQGFYGEVAKTRDGVERDADVIAEHVFGMPLYYAPIDGRLIQTFSCVEGARPRPKGLR